MLQINPSFCSLVPRKEYHGSILKLTEKDKKEIAELQKQKADKEMQLHNLDNIYGKRKHLETHEQNYYYETSINLTDQISRLLDRIREIKVLRLKKQNKT